jgi:hypothetical protein
MCMHVLYSLTPCLLAAVMVHWHASCMLLWDLKRTKCQAPSSCVTLALPTQQHFPVPTSCSRYLPATRCYQPGLDASNLLPVGREAELLGYHAYTGGMHAIKLPTFESNRWGFLTWFRLV